MQTCSEELEEVESLLSWHKMVRLSIRYYLDSWFKSRKIGGVEFECEATWEPQQL